MALPIATRRRAVIDLGRDHSARGDVIEMQKRTNGAGTRRCKRLFMTSRLLFIDLFRTKGLQGKPVEAGFANCLAGSMPYECETCNELNCCPTGDYIELHHLQKFAKSASCKTGAILASLNRKMKQNTTGISTAHYNIVVCASIVFTLEHCQISRLPDQTPNIGSSRNISLSSSYGSLSFAEIRLTGVPPRHLEIVEYYS